MSTQINNHVAKADEALMETVVIENIGDVVKDNASSIAPSRKTTRLRALFPPDTFCFKQMKRDSHLFELLSDKFGFEDHFIERLEKIGCNTPAIVVNTFGLDVRSLAKTLGEMGSMYAFGAPESGLEGSDPYTIKVGLLVTFARMQICSGSFHKKRKCSWASLKKQPSYSTTFEAWDDEFVEGIQMACNSQELHDKAVQVILEARKLLRKWIHQDKISDSSTRTEVAHSTPKKAEPNPSSNAVDISKTTPKKAALGPINNPVNSSIAESIKKQ